MVFVILIVGFVAVVFSALLALAYAKFPKRKDGDGK